ncbi:UNVERIFIED_CONTAM: Retrovirus-related Pol polyprotein from transposon RE1 [Sesamum latifolium]|uniref:Retrovirus-related Pol polyprotein from transposon RE1 n=1 Tax=Sesamum latifolium TaxID=2727402 RepID=A0AAW2WZB8_9LAMI
MISAPFNGNNWLTWSRSVRIALEGKDRLGFIDGSCGKPVEGSIELKLWKITDSLVRTWILSTMAKDIVNAFYTLPQPEASGQSWRRDMESPMVLSCTRSDEKSVPLFKCVCDSNRAKQEEIEEDHLMQFLMGLSEPYDNIRSQILVLDPLPSVNKAYSMILRVERQRKVNMEYADVNENSAMLQGSRLQKLCRTERDYKEKRFILHKTWKWQDLKSKKPLAIGSQAGKLYIIDSSSFTTHIPQLSCHTIVSTPIDSSKYVAWHKRLGHSSPLVLTHISELKITEYNKDFICPVCPLAKQSRKPFPFNTQHVLSLLIWYSLSGCHYVLTLSHDLHHTRLDLPHETQKPNTSHLESFISKIDTQFASHIKAIRTDNSSEFVSHSCQSLLQKHGITHEKSCIYTPQQNGVVEQKHRHLLQVARALMFQSHLPNQFWAESILVATPYHQYYPLPLLIGKPLLNSFTRHLPVMTTSKHLAASAMLQTHSHIKSSLIHEPSNAFSLAIPGQKGYKLYDLDNKVTFTSRDVTFHEHIFPFQSMPYSPPTSDPILVSTTALDHVPTPTAVADPTPPTSVNTEYMPPTTTPHPLFQNFLLLDLLDILNLQLGWEPRCYKEAQGSSEWEEAMRQELHALELNDTWEVVPLPPGKKAIGNKWVYKLKLKADGTIDRHKARLVAKGYNQASRQWNLELTSKLLAFGFLQSAHDHCLFLKHSVVGLIALFYVDDVLITCVSELMITEVKDFLHSTFTIKDLGLAKYFLGLEIARSPSGTSITQHKFIRDIISDTGLLSARPASSPFPPGLKLSAHDSLPLSDAEPYRRLVGRLLYLSFTRPDISFGAQQLSQFVHAPFQVHMAAALHLVRYLSGCPKWGLFFPASNSLVLTAYCDADWASCTDSRRSLTAEYRSLGSTVCELQWISFLLSDLQVSVPTPISLFCDNLAAIHIVANPVFHERTKHLEIDCHLVRDKFKAGFILPLHISGVDQLAIFSQSLSLGRVFSLSCPRWAWFPFPKSIFRGAEENQLFRHR